MLTGKVKAWVHDRGFGFIKLDDGGPDVFVHVSALPDDFDGLQNGQAVAFEVVLDERRGRPQARRVRVV